MTINRRDPAARNRDGARKVPMHPWSDPKRRNQPVTREELIAIIGQIDQSIDVAVRGVEERLVVRLTPVPWWRRWLRRRTP